MIKKVNSVEVAGAKLRDLAARACDRVLVAVGTGCGVIERAQAFTNFFPLFEYLAVSIVGSLINKTSGVMVEACRGCSNAGLTVKGVVRLKYGRSPYCEVYQHAYLHHLHYLFV